MHALEVFVIYVAPFFVIGIVAKLLMKRDSVDLTDAGALMRDEPGQQALCRLLSDLVGGYIEAFDEEALPVDVADHAYQRLLDLVGSLDLQANAGRRLADINRVAAYDLLH